MSSDVSVAGSAHTKSPKLVASFLAFLASPAGQKILSEGSGYFPVGTTNVSTLSAPYKPVASMITSRQYRGFPTIDWPNGKIYADLGSGVQGLLTGQETVPSRCCSRWIPTGPPPDGSGSPAKGLTRCL